MNEECGGTNRKWYFGCQARVVSFFLVRVARAEHRKNDETD